MSTQSAPCRSAQRMGGRGAPTRSRSPLAQAADTRPRSEPWKTAEDADAAPAVSWFQPRRTPEVQLETLSPYCPKDMLLFLVLTQSEQSAAKQTKRLQKKNKYQWTDVEMEDSYKFFGLLVYMSLVSLPSLQDYWRQNHILLVPLPAKVMSRDRFRSMLWDIHLSDPEEDAQNKRKKGTPGHDKLFTVRPLYDDILSACQAYYLLRRELAVEKGWWRRR